MTAPHLNKATTTLQQLSQTQQCASRNALLPCISTAPNTVRLEVNNASTHAEVCMQSYAAFLAGSCPHGLLNARAHTHAYVLGLLTSIMHKVNATGSCQNDHSIGC